MSGGDLLLLAGVFLGGAAPWLEAIVVIPVGIVAGMHPVVAVVVGGTGNLLTVAAAAWFGQRLRRWWIARRARRAAASPVHTGEDPQRRHGKQWQRVERVVRRWGLPALAVLGPIGLGTQVSALVAVSLGISARVAFVWVGAGTVVWSIVAAVAAVTGLNIAGIGTT